MRHIAAIILLAFCSLVYGQEKIAIIFVGEEPKNGTFKPFFSQIQKATIKKYESENRTADFKKLAEQGNEAQISQWGAKYAIFIEISEAIAGYYLEAKMIDVETSKLVKMSTTDSELKASEDVSTAAQKIVAGLFDFSENSSSPAPSSITYETFTDPRDNQSYKTIKKGKYEWMAKNMNFKTGTSWCYSNDNSNCEQYGRLYDWKTAMSVCPDGWKLPSSNEWNDLVRSVGKEVAGKKLKSKNVQGTDDFGFSALLGGRRNAGGNFDYLKEDGRWWTSTTTSEGSNAYYQYMNSRMDNIDENLRPNDLANGYSVRCIKGTKDAIAAKPSNNENALTDPRDNQQYKIVKIRDNFIWMAENMRYNNPKFTSWCYDDDEHNCNRYGRLYDWNAAKKACPDGWHLPSRGEWNDLVRTANDNSETVNSVKTATEATGSFLGLMASAATLSVDGMTKNFVNLMNNVVKFAEELDAVEGNVNAGERLKSKEYKGTNNFGFSALAGGGYSSNNEVKFYYIGKGGAWWTSTEKKDNNKEAYDVFVFSDSKSVREGTFSKSDGYSVRCVKNLK